MHETLRIKIFFEDFGRFSKSNLSISSTSSGRTFHSASIDVLRLFLKWILNLKETPETFENASKSSKEGLSLIIDGFQNQISLCDLHILVERSILHRLMC